MRWPARARRRGAACRSAGRPRSRRRPGRRSSSSGRGSVASRGHPGNGRTPGRAAAGRRRPGRRAPTTTRRAVDEHRPADRVAAPVQVAPAPRGALGGGGAVAVGRTGVGGRVGVAQEPAEPVECRAAEVGGEEPAVEPGQRAPVGEERRPRTRRRPDLHQDHGAEHRALGVARQQHRAVVLARAVRPGAGEVLQAPDQVRDRAFRVARRGQRVHRPRPERAEVPDDADGPALCRVPVGLAAHPQQPEDGRAEHRVARGDEPLVDHPAVPEEQEADAGHQHDDRGHDQQEPEHPPRLAGQERRPGPRPGDLLGALRRPPSSPRHRRPARHRSSSASTGAVAPRRTPRRARP